MRELVDGVRTVKNRDGVGIRQLRHGVPFAPDVRPCEWSGRCTPLRSSPVTCTDLGPTSLGEIRRAVAFARRQMLGQAMPRIADTGNGRGIDVVELRKFFGWGIA